MNSFKKLSKQGLTPMSKNGSIEFSSHGATIESKNVSQMVEHLFRHQAGQVVSTLTRFFGVQNLDLVEDVVQETLLKALQQWMFQGIPENPAGAPDQQPYLSIP